MTATSPPPRVVVMGVSGCGKSTVGSALAARLGVDFGEADELHPRRNIEKMAAGRPLDDSDRAPWLRAVGAWLAERDGRGAVTSCSALKRGYRDLLRAAAPGTVFLHLHGSRELLAERMAARRGHFMPASLLDSQLATLEPLQDDEAGLTVELDRPVGEVVEEFMRWTAR